MLRKNQRPFFFTEWQLQQLKRTTDSLRKLNCAALRELERAGYLMLTNKQYGGVGEFLRVVAIRMTSALRLRDEILQAGREQKPGTILLIFGTQCAACEENPVASPDDQEAAPRKGLEQDPMHHAEIDCLLELAWRTEERVSMRFRPRGAHANPFFAGINRLTMALLRQQRHLRDTVLKQKPVIEVVEEPEGANVCMDCGKPIKSRYQFDTEGL